MKHIIELPEYKTLRMKTYSVYMYDVNDLNVKEWSRGTGCGVSILVSQHVDRAGDDMRSHVWGEDAEGLLQAVVSWYRKEGRDLEKSLWFCVFANYQPEDGIGGSRCNGTPVQRSSTIASWS